METVKGINHNFANLGVFPFESCFFTRCAISCKPKLPNDPSELPSYVTLGLLPIPVTTARPITKQ